MSVSGRLTACVAATAAVAYAGTQDVYDGPMGYLIRRADPERAHRLAIFAAKWGLAAPGMRKYAPAGAGVLRSDVWGLEFRNPVGLAAGFDKDAEAVSGLFAIGFGFVEVGSVTPRAQEGNPKPRVFRLPEDGAIINRYGFNSAGVQVVKENLIRYDVGGRNTDRMGVLGINLGKNKETPEESAVEDYLTGLQELGDLAEYVVINVSSPNTPGLRNLQGKDKLRALLVPLIEARNKLMYKPPLILKIAPDLERQDMVDIAEVILELGVDGLIVSNTTVSRNGLQSENRCESGGLSGRPLKELSTNVLREMYALTGGKIPLIGVGGVESGADAYEKIRAGASLVQLYTALAYKGPFLITRINEELDRLLCADGFTSIADAVGADHRPGARPML